MSDKSPTKNFFTCPACGRTMGDGDAFLKLTELPNGAKLMHVYCLSCEKEIKQVYLSPEEIAEGQAEAREEKPN